MRSPPTRKLSLIGFPGGKQGHMTHCTHYTNHWFPLVCDLLKSPELHGPELDHCFKQVFMNPSPFHLIQNGTSLIGQGMKTTFNLLKPVILKVSLKENFGTQSKT